jgi:hypothetical protein
MLSSWNEGAARRAVVEFVEGTVAAGVPGNERFAVFDNDGTLWCEKPMPIQADFIVRRLADMAQADPRLHDRQPWKAASERDYGWFGQVLAEHYAGDDTNVAPLLGGILAAWAGISVEDFEAQSEAFLRTAQHPTLGRGYLECAYAPMIELLGLSGSERVRELHRLRWRPGLHAADQPGGLRGPAGPGDRERYRARIRQQ